MQLAAHSKILFTERVNVDLMSLYLQHIYQPRHYSTYHDYTDLYIGLKGSRPCLMIYAQGMWSAMHIIYASFNTHPPPYAMPRFVTIIQV